jgi:fatty-acid peroxygenase
VVVGGPEGVRRFYDGRLRRRGAVPFPVGAVLFGRGAVHGLDDDAHHRRKALHLAVLGDRAVDALVEESAAQWQHAVIAWHGRPVVLFDEAVRVLGASVLPWAGVTGAPDWVAPSLAQVVDGFGAPGKPYWQALQARRRLDRWATGLVEEVRARRRNPPAGGALAVMARATVGGGPLPARVAGVELLNIVRPTIAVAWFVAWAGLRLAEHPDWRARIAAGDDDALTAFAHEVRRHSPFAPVLAAKARKRQDVLGLPVRRGTLVVLDVHGTNRDPRAWAEADTFDPSRFLDRWDSDAYLPHGGGSTVYGHRCPGEQLALGLLKAAVSALAAVPYRLADQDLDVDYARMPTLPHDRVVIAVE